MVPVKGQDLWTCAQTAWGEARGEGEAGLLAVCHVIRNRATLHRRWNRLSVHQVCRAAWQFSCWNASDPNATKAAQVGLEDATFRLAAGVALRVLSGTEPSNVGEATHYYRAGSPMPAWATGQTPCAVVGHHLFFAEIA
jgi:spore germination cell wall hydrolase CwlJ-like protein